MNNSFLSACLDDSYHDFASENKNTDIGYDHTEIAATSTEDLLVLRRAIYSYLKSPNLKKRNPNYLKVFKRINEELKLRKSKDGMKSFPKSEKPEDEASAPVDKEASPLKRTPSFAIDNKYNKNLFGEKLNQEVENKSAFPSCDFIKRKRANTCDSELSVDIPSFLQDKSKSNKNSEEVSNILDLKINALKALDYDFGNVSSKDSSLSSKMLKPLFFYYYYF